MDEMKFDIEIDLTKDSGTIIVPVADSVIDSKGNLTIVPIDYPVQEGIMPLATSGSFSGGGDSKLYLKFNWTQTKGSTTSTLGVSMYVYTQYTLTGYARSGSHITVNGNKKSITDKYVNATGDKWIGSHDVSISHTGAISIAISGAVVWNGTYNGTYYSTVSASGTASMDGIIFSPRVKVGGTYRTGKGCYVKVGGTYRLSKGTYVKVGGTYRLCK